LLLKVAAALSLEDLAQNRHYSIKSGLYFCCKKIFLAIKFSHFGLSFTTADASIFNIQHSLLFPAWASNSPSDCRCHLNQSRLSTTEAIHRSHHHNPLWIWNLKSCSLLAAKATLTVVAVRLCFSCLVCSPVVKLIEVLFI